MGANRKCRTRLFAVYRGTHTRTVDQEVNQDQSIIKQQSKCTIMYNTFCIDICSVNGKLINGNV